MKTELGRRGSWAGYLTGHLVTSHFTSMTSTSSHIIALALKRLKMNYKKKAFELKEEKKRNC